MQSSTAAVLWEAADDPADADLPKEDESRFKDLLRKRKAFVTLSARSLTSSMGENSDCQGTLNVQVLTCRFLADFLLEFCLHEKLVFSLWLILLLTIVCMMIILIFYVKIYHTCEAIRWELWNKKGLVCLSKKQELIGIFITLFFIWEWLSWKTCVKEQRKVKK